MTQGGTDKLSSGRELMGNIELETPTVKSISTDWYGEPPVSSILWSKISVRVVINSFSNLLATDSMASKEESNLLTIL